MSENLTATEMAIRTRNIMALREAEFAHEFGKLRAETQREINEAMSEGGWVFRRSRLRKQKIHGRRV